MYSKNVILFFCVSSYFLQCQGILQTCEPDELQVIGEVIEEYSNHEGKVDDEEWAVNLTGLRDIIAKVEERRNTNTEIFSVDDLSIHLSNFTYTEDEVINIVNPFISENSETAPDVIIHVLFISCDKPKGITFDDLGDLINSIRYCYSSNVIPTEFPYLGKPKTAISYKMSTKDCRTFNKKEVEFIVGDYLCPDERLLQ